MRLIVRENAKIIISSDPRELPSLPSNLEARLPLFDQNLRITHAEWLPVTNTRYIFFNTPQNEKDCGMKQFSYPNLNNNLQVQIFRILSLLR